MSETRQTQISVKWLRGYIESMSDQRYALNPILEGMDRPRALKYLNGLVEKSVVWLPYKD